MFSVDSATSSMREGLRDRSTRSRSFLQELMSGLHAFMEAGTQPEEGGDGAMQRSDEDHTRTNNGEQGSAYCIASCSPSVRQYCCFRCRVQDRSIDGDARLALLGDVFLCCAVHCTALARSCSPQLVVFFDPRPTETPCMF